MTSQSRFATVSRRALLQGMSAAALLGLVACSTDDAAVLRPTARPTEGEADASVPASAAPTATGSTGAATAEKGEYLISFSYTADTSATASGESGGRGHGGGMVRNPYIAVWVEDASGSLVRTISLWHLQNGQDRWLSKLHRWYGASGGADTISSATRAAGAYTLSWDGLDADGKALVAGTYTLCVEATREHGPYSLATGELQVSGKALHQELAANGELSAVSVAYTPA